MGIHGTRHAEESDVPSQSLVGFSCDHHLSFLAYPLLRGQAGHPIMYRDCPGSYRTTSNEMTTQDHEDLELNAKAAGGSLKEEIRQLLKDFLQEKTKCENLQEELNDAKIEIEVILKNQLLATIQRDRAIDIANGIMDWDKPGDARQSMKELSALKKEIRG